MITGHEKGQYLKELKNVIIFRSLTDEELESLLPFIEIISFDPEEKIITEGDLSPSFFAVLHGTVVVTVKQEENEVYICSIGEGDTFGEAAMFLKVKRTATITSSDETIVLKMVRHDMLRYISQNPKAGNKILMLMIYSLLKKLREANKELAFERRADIDQADVDAIMNDLNL